MVNETNLLLLATSEQESTYNHKVIWKFIDTVRTVTPCYGILIDKSRDMELVLLETTGPFGLKDITCETTDYVKAAYGLMTVLYRLKVYFVHAAGEKIRLWFFGLQCKRRQNITQAHLPEIENIMFIYCMKVQRKLKKTKPLIGTLPARKSRK
ncbi:hypothetical protein BD560DRAFT_490071 [Blakeslea trispora]|nr:hypothetical protein BD560DRAFT_490071 [Blakeslea trispora]